MPISRRRSAALAIALLMAVCAAAAPGSARAQDADSALIGEARAFMEAYARDLGTADREAIANRYDRRGAYFIFNGARDLPEWEAIREQYRTRWEPPAAFEWGELIYEPVGSDAVLVNGLFFWTVAPGQAPMRFSYTGLLVRQDGELRIRLENEFIVPAPPAAEAPPTP
jgi:hypothetical protein